MSLKAADIDWSGTEKGKASATQGRTRAPEFYREKLFILVPNIATFKRLALETAIKRNLCSPDPEERKVDQGGWTRL